MADEHKDMPIDDQGPTLVDIDGQGGRQSFRIVPGDSIGPFKILSVIGEGGFGIVFLAEQTQPVKRRVALKVIKAGMDTDMVVARFEAERQAVAMMNHPGIAKVFEAGATEHGRPYFVMEYVQGDPLNVYCDKQALDMDQRLELFTKVCDAVQHAHQRGIIHRDLKPGNILVTVNDRDEPQPKVIDFGIAKATSQQLTEKTIFTEHGQMIGTPEYMSPEQAEMASGDIDTRTDVYSLGVILYELLSGRLPFDPKDLRSKGYAEIQRIIREEDPPRPSTRLTTTATQDPEDTRLIAKARQTTIETLSTTLRKELEWIPVKALRKDRTERYSSAESLGEDVRRYLRGDPLEAGPEAATYRLRKLVKRHKGPFIAAALIAVSLLAGIVVSTIFAVEASRQTVIAQKEREVAVERLERLRVLLGELSGPINESVKNLSGGLEVRRLMLDAGKRQLDLVREAAEASADPMLLHAVGRSHNSFGDLAGGARTASEGDRAEAMRHYNDAEDIYRALLSRRMELEQPQRGEVDQMLPAILKKKADLLILAGDRDSAEELVLESRAILEPHFDDGDQSLRRQYFLTYEYLWDMETDRGDHEAALTHATSHARAMEGLLEQDADNRSLQRGLAMILRRVGYTQGELGQHQDAEDELMRSLELFEAVSASQPDDIRRRRDVAWSRYYLGQLLTELPDPRERLDEAAALYVKAADGMVSVCIAEPGESDYRGDVAKVLPHMHDVLVSMGRAEEADGMRRSALLALQPMVEAEPENLALAEVLERIRSIDSTPGSG